MRYSFSDFKPYLVEGSVPVLMAVVMDIGRMGFFFCVGMRSKQMYGLFPKWSCGLGLQDGDSRVGRET